MDDRQKRTTELARHLFTEARLEAGGDTQMIVGSMCMALASICDVYNVEGKAIGEIVQAYRAATGADNG